MLSAAPRRVLASSPYWAARSHPCNSPWPGTSTSADQSSRQAASFAAKTRSQPRRAARCAVSRASSAGAREVRAVSTPTYFSKVYVRPARTGAACADAPVRRVSTTPEPLRIVCATAPSTPVPSVRNVPSSRSVIRRAPRSSSRPVTVAVPLQRGVIRRRTAPAWTSERSASTSYTRSVARPSAVVHRSEVRTRPQERKTVCR